MPFGCPSGGFVEGEGTFGFKNLVPYFQVGQHSRSVKVIEAISRFFISINSYKQNYIVNITLTLNKRTNVTVVTNQSVDALYETIAPFFIVIPFQTRKRVDFLYWILVLYMHKHGHFYLREGREFVINVTNVVNNNRYSNRKNTDLLMYPVFPSILLKSTIPVLVKDKQTHTELAKSFARVLPKPEIWIYDIGTLVVGSPFQSYGKALIAIGKPTSASIVRRLVNTGKVYNNRYSFYTIPQTKLVVK